MRAGTTAFTATFAGLLAAIAVSAALAQEGEKQLYEGGKERRPADVVDRAL